MFLTLWLLAASTPADQSMTPEAVCARALASQYTTQTGDTVDLVAKKFQLKPATLLGANPAIQQRPVRPGDVLTILPKDGILYKPKPEERFPEIAQRFRVPPGTLFEINGCQMQSQLFIPGVIWQAPSPKPKPIAPAPSAVPKPATAAPSFPVPKQLQPLRLPKPPDVPPAPDPKKKTKKKPS
ncbi:MAG: LysM peptidoglycan-binding domain-containing protein [Anaerolineae bacterium]|nr:LysM peptidoglycan-binding domain-containing protein [Gloeobacterales cyanobacterium ES-bin-313]